MRLFGKNHEEEIDELREEEICDIDVIDLDDTANWSSLAVEEKIEKVKEVKEEEPSFAITPGKNTVEMEFALSQVIVEKPEEKEVDLSTVTIDPEEIATVLRKTELVNESNTTEMTEDYSEDLSENSESTEDIEYYNLSEEETSYEATMEVDDEDDEEDDEEDGFFFALSEFFGRFTTFDKVIAITGSLILILGVVVGSLYYTNSVSQKQIAALAPVGQELSTIGIAGDDVLLAIADAKRAEVMVVEEVEELKEYEETETENDITVVMNLTSVQRDLKIKFVNKQTKKLIPNVSFTVKIEDPDGKSFEKKDEDKDGIIYMKDIKPGKYKVSMVELTGEDGLIISTKEETVQVKENIDYKKIDVADEVKKESQVNAAVEDTAAKVETEAVLQNTVEWVESTKTPLNGSSTGYEAVDKGNIDDPAAKYTSRIAFYKMSKSETGDGNETSKTDDPPQTGDDKENTGGDAETSSGGTNNTEGDTPNAPETIAVTGVSLDNSSLELPIDQTATLKVTVEPEKASNKTVRWKSSNPAVAAVDDAGTVKAVGKGEATITATSEDGGITASCTIKVIEQTTTVTEIALSTNTLSLKVGGTATLTATVKPDTATNKTVTFTSDKTEVASVDTAGKVTAKAVGSATITAKSGDKTATCKVTVNADPKTDTTTLLKDRSGNQLYILKDGKYIEAKVADYYTNSQFYKKAQAATEFRYTGWQDIDGKTYFFDKNGNKVTGEQVIQGAKYNFASDGSLNKGSGTMGIDVSKWNGNINWSGVKNSGVSYVIIRCGYRGSTTGALIEDPKFRTNIQGAINAGLKVGIYFFTQAVNEVEAVEEASMTIGLIRGYKISYPVFLDVESSGGRADGLDSGTRTKVVNAFCQTIRNSGYTAGVYANKTWLSSKMNAGALSGYKIWLAQYNTAPTYGGKYDLWQYSSKGSVGGISGNVDMNLSYLGY
ncbi:MAG: Ig-like domain-containing protein [Lachnospiraceae bacterium]|nr:Ig-like domain-containing protein [Lachnospiraceae bacterium]